MKSVMARGVIPLSKLGRVPFRSLPSLPFLSSYFHAFLAEPGERCNLAYWRLSEITTLARLLVVFLAPRDAAPAPDHLPRVEVLAKVYPTGLRHGGYPPLIPRLCWKGIQVISKRKGTSLLNFVPDSKLYRFLVVFFATSRRSSQVSN